MKAELRNYWIFPSLVVASLSLAYFYEKWWLLLPAAYFLGVIIRKKRWGLLVPLVFCGFFCCWQISGIEVLRADQPVKYQGELRIYADTVKLNGQLVSFEAEDQAGGVLRCSYFLKKDQLPQWQDLSQRPSRLAVTGELQAPVGQRNLGGFHQRDYYRSQGLYASLTIKKVTAQTRQNSFSLRQLRAFLIWHIQGSFPPRLATYLNALLTGFRSADYQTLQTELSASGIMHLFSISGMHILMMLGSLEYLLRRSGLTALEQLPLLLGIAAGLFALLGGSSSVLRALVMFLFAKYTRNQFLRFSALDRFAIVLLLLNLLDPLLLMKTGGQLSVVIAFFLMMLPELKGRGQSWRTAIWLTVVAAPVIASFFYDWPLLGGLLTVIYLPIFAWFYLPVSVGLLLLSLVGLCPEWLKLLVGRLFHLTELPLHYLDWSVLRLGSLPVVLVVILTCSGLVILESRRKVWRVGLVCLLVPWLWQRLDPTTEIFFVDVGQGDAIVFKAPFLQETILMDTGGKVSFGETTRQTRANADYTLIPFLKSQGITKLDKIILTHSDTDHLGDLDQVVKHFKVRALYVGAGSKDDPIIANELSGKKLPIYEVQAGDRIKGYFDLQILAPAAAGEGKNEDSVVVYTQVGRQRFLFTGDLDQGGERQLLQHYPNMTADVLKVGHHGSRTSTNAAFIQQLQPRAAVISAGKNNRFGHPHEEVVSILTEAQVEILRTDLQHMIYYRWFPWQKQSSPHVVGG